MVANVAHVKSAGGIVVNRNGEILVVSQRGNSWSLPKGRIESGEDDLAAAKREVHEESGLTNLEFVRRLGSYERYRIGEGGKGDDTSQLKTIIMFLFRTNENSLKPIDPDNPEAHCVSKEKVAELLTHPKDKEFFLKVSKAI